MSKTYAIKIFTKENSTNLNYLNFQKLKQVNLHVFLILFFINKSRVKLWVPHQVLHQLMQFHVITRKNGYITVHIISNLQPTINHKKIFNFFMEEDLKFSPIFRCFFTTVNTNLSEWFMNVVYILKYNPRFTTLSKIQ